MNSTNTRTIKTITHGDNGTRWEFFAQENGLFGYRYFERYAGGGWRKLWTVCDYTADALALAFGFDTFAGLMAA